MLSSLSEALLTSTFVPQASLGPAGTSLTLGFRKLSLSEALTADVSDRVADRVADDAGGGRNFVSGGGCSDEVAEDVKGGQDFVSGGGCSDEVAEDVKCGQNFVGRCGAVDQRLSGS